MPKSVWTTEHVDHLCQLVRGTERTYMELSKLMSQHFHMRITTAHVGQLLTRMRKPGDPFFRNMPYRRGNARRI